MMGRMVQLDRENRRLKQAGAAVLILMATVVLTGQATSSKVTKLVEAERFVLRDASRTVRAALSIDADGVSLTFADAKGNRRLTVQENNLSLFVDGKKEAVATLEAWPEFSGLRLRHKGVGTSIVMGATENGPIFTFLHEPVPFDPAKAFQPVIFTMNLGTGSPELTFFNTEGKVIWRAP